jgi:hypothetical protein
LPTLEELGLSFTPIDSCCHTIQGGETEALAFESLFYETKTFCLQRNKKRNGGRRLSSKFSAWLALAVFLQEQSMIR